MGLPKTQVCVNRGVLKTRRIRLWLPRWAHLQVLGKPSSPCFPFSHPLAQRFVDEGHEHAYHKLQSAKKHEQTRASTGDGCDTALSWNQAAELDFTKKSREPLGRLCHAAGQRLAATFNTPRVHGEWSSRSLKRISTYLSHPLCLLAIFSSKGGVGSWLGLFRCVGGEPSIGHFAGFLVCSTHGSDFGLVCFGGHKASFPVPVVHGTLPPSVLRVRERWVSPRCRT